MVQSVHCQAQRLEGEAKLAVHRDQPTQPLPARREEGGRPTEPQVERGLRKGRTKKTQEAFLEGGKEKKEKLNALEIRKHVAALLWKEHWLG